MNTFFLLTRAICLCLLICFNSKIFSQTYPITATLRLQPPYSVYLSDYTAPGSEKLFVSILLNDLNEPAWQVKLRISIEGVGIKIHTNPNIQLPPATLQGGVPLRLDPAQLAPCFDANNLIFEGYTRQQYQRNAALPEGFYKFCLQVYDYQRNIPLSNISCYSAWLVLNDPPRVITPVCNSIVQVLYPQNLVFQWLPMHVTSPNAGFSTEYLFQLVEILPQGRNPNDAIQSSPSIFETVLQHPTLYYGIAEPQLIPGHSYAWRVRARDSGGRDMFKNNGYSEVCMFTYGEPCRAPKNIRAETESARRTRIFWDPVTGARNYVVRYRPQGTPHWYEDESFSCTHLISGLEPGTRYEYQVQCVCDPIGNEYSRTDTFSTFSPPGVRNCEAGQASGAESGGTLPDNTTVLSSLFPGDILEVDGFSVKVTHASGNNGIFSGKGIAYIPFLNAHILTSFQNIRVNTQRQVYEGSIIADRTDTERYRSQLPSPPLRNDICQGSDPSGGNGGQSPGTGGAQGGGNNPADVTGILINGETTVMVGDTILVNGEQVVVTRDTRIREGDVVVIKGVQITVSSVQTLGAGQPGALADDLKNKIKDLLKEIRKEQQQKADSLQKEISSSEKILDSKTAKTNLMTSAIKGEYVNYQKNAETKETTLSTFSINPAILEIMSAKEKWQGNKTAFARTSARLTYTDNLLSNDSGINELAASIHADLTRLDQSVLENYKKDSMAYKRYLKKNIEERIEERIEKVAE